MSNGDARHRLFRDERLLVSLEGSAPATAGCWSATRSVSSIRCIPRACCSRCKSGELAADAIARDWRTATPRPRSSASGATGFKQGVDRMRRLVCEYYDGFSFGKFVRKYPAAAQHGHRSADRRSLHRSRGQSLGADGVAVSAGEEAIPPWQGGPARRRRTKPTSWCCRKDVARKVWSEYVHRRRVQFYETDAAGIVHFSWYFRYMEEAEHALWRAAGLSVPPPGGGVGWPRVRRRSTSSGRCGSKTSST